MTYPRSRAKRTAWTAGVLAAGLAAGLLSSSPAQSMGGDEVTGGADPFAVKLHLTIGKDNDRACSGTLVDEQWVLTAASCFAADPRTATKIAAGAPPYPTVVTADGNRPAAAPEKQKVLELLPHPDRDLVMARVDDPSVENPLDGPFPDRNRADVATVAPAQGDQLRAVGFGRTGSDWVPGKAHTGDFRVDTVDSATLGISPTSGGAVCPGDAGGPVLNARGKLVGIVTASWGGGCFNSDETRTGALATRVDDIADWVQRVRMTHRRKFIKDAMTTADFNGDGRTDVASHMADGTIQVFYSRPDGTLQFGTYLPALGNSRVQQILAGDFDDAPGVEVITVWDSGDVFIGSKREPSPFWIGKKLWTDTTWKQLLPAAVLHSATPARDTPLFQWPDGSLYTYKRDAGGDLVNQKKSMWPDKTWKKERIATADFNGDGREDIAAVAADGALHLYPGKADGTFDKARSMWSGKDWTSYRPLLSGDFNGDGKADLASVEVNGELRWFAGDGKGALAAGKSMWPKV
ncbi:FG-GAP-like repeat-containing protein [Streptomyces djakartensis]|uniref:Hydrolase n=1 Tax=Streptomyces djakartensis TaxID=68193 RepID=A0ABQ2ZVA3_9ACTN|nr:FG-GAP-like repeat-containing protein [Streptomyces djakartensis]GGY26931.1 hydrolase [Streptomyces djakartensis]